MRYLRVLILIILQSTTTSGEKIEYNFLGRGNQECTLTYSRKAKSVERDHNASRVDTLDWNSMNTEKVINKVIRGNISLLDGKKFPERVA